MLPSVPAASPVRPPRPARVPPGPRPPLERDRECLVSGTCSSLARHLGAPVWATRALFVVLTPLGGFGVLLYAWCWMLTPWRAGASTPSRHAPVAWLLTAPALLALLIVVTDGGYAWRYGITPGSTPAAVVALPVVLVLATAAGVWAGLVDRADPARGPRHALIVQALAIAALVLLLVTLSLRDMPALLLLLPLAGIAAVLSTTLIRRWRELSGERIRRIREEQRSEMAAHLHDSVLQTLALIQNRAGASSEVARLARAQERELRAWLYDGDSPADSDLPTDLRDYAAALELDYPARIDVVSAGLSTERASGELAAAAREAMLNAAQHAGGEVSVYIEGAASGVDVFIRDRGDGFAMDDVPGDRLGVRESIIGRMRRAGGAATVRSEAHGTEVHLRIGLTAQARPTEAAASETGAAHA